MCPVVRGVVPVCKNKCEKDSDCDGDDQKCCDVGCGTRTCIKAGDLVKSRQLDK